MSDEKKYYDKMDEMNQRKSSLDEEKDAQQEARDTRHYYSYGPFQSHVKSSPSSQVLKDDEVEISQPKPIKNIHIGFDGETDQEQRERLWKASPPPKKSRSSAFILTFLAGALLIGVLMFIADSKDFFTTPDTNVEGAQSSSPYEAETRSSSADVQTANLDLNLPMDIPALVEQTSASVVKIDTYQSAARRGQSNSMMDDPIFREFFGDFFGNPRQPSVQESPDGRVQTGIGTGFFFDEQGYILTNAHVVVGAEHVEVTVLGHKDPFEATVLGVSQELDLAVIKINSDEKFTALKFGDSDETAVGEWLVAIGNPQGFDHTVTVGVLSQKERDIPIRDDSGNIREYKNLIQTDAAINPGNSGGPLLDLYGHVIGVNTAVSTSAQGIGFAIPSSIVLTVLDDLKNNRTIPSPFIGIEMVNIDEGWVEQLQLENDEGALVQSVLSNTPAARSGLRPGDVIIDIDGEKITSSKDVSEYVLSRDVGDTLTMKVIRDGQEREMFITIGDRNQL